MKGEPQSDDRGAVRIIPLDDERAPAWAALFEACGSACFCHFWHFAGTKNDWLAQCAQEPRRNRDEQLALVHRSAPEGSGLVALHGDLAVGWIKLAPRPTLIKLLRQGAYRPLDLGPNDGIWSVGCLLVHPGWRRRGVARAMIAASSAYVGQWGGRAVEAYPRRVDHVVHDEQAFMGTESLFASCGFVHVAGDGPYPVLRKAVAESARL